MKQNELRKQIMNQGKDYVMIVFGLALYAFGFTAFILPNQVVTGGVLGLTSILYYAFKIDVAYSNYAINLLLLAIAWRSIDKQFIIRTIFGASAASVIIGIFQPMFREGLVHGQPFMCVVIGATLCGIGIGTTFAHNGSSAGTDIIAAMVTKRSNISFGRMMLYCDVLIISSSFLLFKKVDAMVYGYIFLIINSIVTDMVINNNRQAVQFLIFSEKWEEIANAINNLAKRGCTLVHGTGWYTKRDVKMLIVLCRRFEAMTIIRIVRALDNEALISQTNTRGVYGLGFDDIKVNLHKFKPNAPDETTPAVEAKDIINN